MTQLNLHLSTWTVQQGRGGREEGREWGEEDTGLCCGFPGAPAHSSVSFSTTELGPGTVASYSCDRGFELLGPARKICAENSTWTPPGIPFCGEY
ncbi:hypothetical protein Pmani_038774 [Petrolisthes manimaculis]|uniref:Sushi domain-containing protein n=1 Tax=Petrolisthes manimaculis TaxID=1843537 RepID=A0AAE1TJY1_9EUCA|nr:hypothetical protein Pmani_038774 [Petrolisthes manimaculis]